MTFLTRAAGAAAVLAFSTGIALAEPAVVYDSGGKFDKGFNESAFNGMEQYKKESGKSYLEFEVQTDAQREQAIRRFAQKGADPIVTVGFAQGTASQLVGDRFKVLTGTDIVNVPYKGGAGALPDFLGGRIQMLLPTPATTVALIRDGKTRALAITSGVRSPDLPDVPTMIECGLPELTLDFWAGMLAPAGTPPAVVEKLNAAINASLQSPEMKASMSKLGFEAKIGSPQDFSAFIAEELPRWAKIVKSSGTQ